MSQKERWLKNYPVENTRIRYDLTLKYFCKHFGVTPEETLTWTVEQAEDNLLDWKASRLTTHAGSTIRLDFSVIRQWFLFNRIRVMVQCKNVSTAKTYLDYIPNREDVQRLIDGAKLHHKVAIALLAFSGLRPIDVARLEYQNIKASYLKGDDILTIIKQHQKSKEWYIGFVGHQATRYIRGYLEARIDQGEKINDSSPVVRWDEGALTSKGLRKAVQRIIDSTVGRHPTGETFRRFRPYCLRKYFRRTANKIGYAEAEYLMGHRKGLESLAATYGGLRDLDQQAIDALKKKYIEILPELETEITDVTLKAQLERKEREKKALKDELSDMRTDLEEIKDFIQKRQEMDR